MNFANPWLLAGLALASLPVLIHLLDKRRLPKQTLPTLRFLYGINRQVKRRIRLRDALLLAARVLATALLAVLVARPLGAKPEVAAATHGEELRDTVFVLDTSHGMRYRLADQPLIESAKKRIAAEASDLRPGEEAALVLCGLQWRLAGEGFGRGARLPALVAEAKADDGAPDLTDCIRRALSLAAKSRNANVELRVYTNLAAVGWEGDLPPAPTDRAITLDVVDMAGAEMPNRALTGVEVERGYGNAGEEWTALISATNFGPPAAAVAVKLATAEETVLAQGFMDWKGPGPVEKRLALKPTDQEFAGGEAALDPDALPEDDAMPFQFYFGKPVGVLVVDGAPGTFAEESAAYYPMTALRPTRTRTSVAPRILTRTNLSSADLAGIDVVMLVNVGNLNESTAAVLRTFVETGGGLFWAMGDRVTPEAYARFAALVPGRFRTLRDLRGPAHEPVSFKGFPAKHPIFRDLGQANFATAVFRVYQQIEALPRDAEVLLEFADGAPALVEMPLAKGRVLWFASSLDDAWSNLPYRPFYLPLLQQSVRYLAGTLKPATQRSFPLGSAVDLGAFLGQRRALVRAPGDRTFSVDPAKDGGRVAADDTQAAGEYRVTVDGKRLPDADFMVLRPAEASDLTRLSAPTLQGRISAAGYGGGVRAAGDEADEGFDPVPPLIGLLALLLIGEASLARRRFR